MIKLFIFCLVLLTAINSFSAESKQSEAEFKAEQLAICLDEIDAQYSMIEFDETYYPEVTGGDIEDMKEECSGSN